MKKLMILLGLGLCLTACDLGDGDCEECGECDSGDCEDCEDCEECDTAEDPEPILCCYSYPSGNDEICALTEGLNQEECEDLARAADEEHPADDGAIHWASIPMFECSDYVPDWCPGFGE